MTFTLVDYHGHRTDLSNPDEAGKRFDWQADAIMPHGGSGQRIDLERDGQPMMRVDIDIEAGRAALRWLPDGTHATELDRGEPIDVYESPDGGLETIPGALARVSPEAARAAVAEFVATGKRPTCVTWSQ